jgi:hypothetical protein
MHFFLSFGILIKLDGIKWKNRVYLIKKERDSLNKILVKLREDECPHTHKLVFKH